MNLKVEFKRGGKVLYTHRVSLNTHRVSLNGPKPADELAIGMKNAMNMARNQNIDLMDDDVELSVTKE